MPPSLSKLGIIAGGGRLPEILFQRCRDVGRPVFVAILGGQGDGARFPGATAETFRLGAVGKLIKRLKSQEISEIVLSGAVARPSLKDLLPDLWTARFLARSKAFGLGDDGLLKAIVAALEAEEGFRVVAPHDLVPDLLAATGAMGAVALPPERAADLAAGIAGAKALGARDAGQAVIARDGALVAEEGPAGTEAMIAAGGPAALGGILVKAMKPGQEARVDLPAVGPDTVIQAVAAGLAGIAVEAGRSLTLDRADMVRLADAAGLFLYGFSDRDVRP